MTYYIDDSTNCRIRIDSKRLNSGKYQVRFQTCESTGKSRYGYVLAEEGSTLKEVIAQVRKELNQMRHGDLYFHAHLFSLGKTRQPSNVFVFER